MALRLLRALYVNALRDKMTKYSNIALNLSIYNLQLSRRLRNSQFNRKRINVKCFQVLIKYLYMQTFVFTVKLCHQKFYISKAYRWLEIFDSFNWNFEYILKIYSEEMRNVVFWHVWEELLYWFVLCTYSLYNLEPKVYNHQHGVV